LRVSLLPHGPRSEQTQNTMPQGMFKPGAVIPTTGLYAVRHAGHRPEHEAMLFSGEDFPPCLQCGNEVQFRLISAGTSAHDDKDFKRLKRKAKGRH
jgi:hypothetical protein